MKDIIINIIVIALLAISFAATLYMLITAPMIEEDDYEENKKDETEEKP